MHNEKHDFYLFLQMSSSYIKHLTNKCKRYTVQKNENGKPLVFPTEMAISKLFLLLFLALIIHMFIPNLSIYEGLNFCLIRTKTHRMNGFF